MLPIRQATDADGVPLARLIASVFAEYENCPFVPGEFPELAAPATYYAARGGRLWVVPGTDDEMLGSIAVARHHRSDTAELFKVYLSPALRGTGLSGRLLETALDHAAGPMAARRVELWSDSRFARGHAFYAKHGFVRMAGLRALHDVAETLEFGFSRGLSGRSPGAPA